ncbi:MAG: phosphoribosylamine--glycine ligase [Anaerolineales bacterium]|nr:phosphoribosylamine--glycine ligase [Anaerolineales bacterium]
MHVMVIGSGGREHTLAWKLAQSPLVTRLSVAPGNGGTAAIADNIAIDVTDIPGLVSFARHEKVDLAVVGPEIPLAAGVVDAFIENNLKAFGPTRAAAQLESSKAFAKTFMIDEGIPTPRAKILTDFDSAMAYLETQSAPVVIKASGLAAGKGVLICSTIEEARKALDEILVQRVFGKAGDTVLIEECITGEEVSVLAFCDGLTVSPMIPARDYKRVGENDQGLNTGGMGCYAPSPFLNQDQIEQVTAEILQLTVNGMNRRGTPYVGVLYAGLMITSNGFQVLEFNCRFGDPETQVILPLLESDLVDVFLACLEGRLDETDIRWSSAASACVVLASGGYPGPYEKGKTITGTGRAELLEDVAIFHAGTRMDGDRLMTAGGRVLAAMGIGSDLPAALGRAYSAVNLIHFDGMHFRRDIGASTMVKTGAYSAAGVDINAGDRAVELMKSAVQRTYSKAVLAGVGAFGGLFSLEGLGQASDPVLVASTDGVGTKTMIAAAMGKFDTVGHDIVNHCVNDILVQGARPLFFLDYIASGRIVPEQIAAVVSGCAAACREVHCALLGGETAEMPGVYHPGSFDLVGTMIGWVERESIIDGKNVMPGDICLGLRSSGLHTNGYSLARRIFEDIPWETEFPELGSSIGYALLTPHRAYLKKVEILWEAGVEIKAMAHITGGGFPGNIPRVLPDGIGTRIDRTAWEAPAIFRLIRERGQVDELEMYRVFNMGIGMVLMMSRQDAERALAALPSEALIIGEAFAWDSSEPRVRL